jgi:hypothetical protein
MSPTIVDPAKAAMTLDGYKIDVFGPNGRVDVYTVRDGQYFLNGSNTPTDPSKLRGARFDIHVSSNET